MNEKDILEEIFGKKHDFEELTDEEKYDAIMERGRNLYETRKSYGDAYAFHIAVEFVARQCKQHNIEIR